MLKKQALIAGGGLLLVLVLFFFGKTVQKKAPARSMASQATAPAFDIKQFIGQAKQKLTPAQAVVLGKLENSVGRGDVLHQQIEANTQLANFWKDSAQAFEPYIYYLSQAAKLDNSEKNLTFAAQLILDNLHGEQDPAKLDWESEEAISLFEQALKLNPESDDLKIGLGSCYIYGKGRSGKPEETMKGIQQVLAVARKDSNNMKAQLVLGVGGFVSGQYDKAIERLTRVVKFDPNNLEAIEFLALCYANTGNKTEAIKWYQFMKKQANNAEYTKEIDKRIQLLQ
ncbi:MAG: tetratricopeptide repeat protein [Bacteroidetes bacterium]|nr:tetratricopeptide repeat protein [Bacteroidota bacterium]